MVECDCKDCLEHTTLNVVKLDKNAVKLDKDKIRTDLIPVLPLEQIARVLTYGAKKYSDRNWEKGFDFSRCYGAALRHLFSWWDGEDTDAESNLSHLAHAMCCLLFLQEYQLRHTGNDDRPHKQVIT